MKKILNIFILPVLFAVAVSCSDDDYKPTPDEVTVVSVSETLFDAVGGSGTIIFTSTAPVSVAPENGWITIDSYSTTNGRGTIEFTVSPSFELIGRGTGISIRSANTTMQVGIRQLGIFVSIDDDKLYIPAASGRVALPAQTNGDVLSFRFEEIWAKGTTVDDTFYLEYEGNSSVANRTGILTIRSGQAVRELEVIQSGVKLEPEDDAFYVNVKAGQTSLTLSPNIGDSFTVTPSDAWFTVSSEGEVVTVSASENTTGSLRTGTVRVNYSGQTGTINVIQPSTAIIKKFREPGNRFFNFSQSAGIFPEAFAAPNDFFLNILKLGRIQTQRFETNDTNIVGFHITVSGYEPFSYRYNFSDTESDYEVQVNYMNPSTGNGELVIGEPEISNLVLTAIPRKYKIRVDNWSNPTYYTFTDVENPENWFNLYNTQVTNP